MYLCTKYYIYMYTHVRMDMYIHTHVCEVWSSQKCIHWHTVLYTVLAQSVREAVRVRPLLGLGLLGGAGGVAAGKCTTLAWKEEAIPDRLTTFNLNCCSSPTGQDEPKSKWMG